MDESVRREETGAATTATILADVRVAIPDEGIIRVVKTADDDDEFLEEAHS